MLCGSYCPYIIYCIPYLLLSIFFFSSAPHLARFSASLAQVNISFTPHRLQYTLEHSVILFLTLCFPSGLLLSLVSCLSPFLSSLPLISFSLSLSPFFLVSFLLSFFSSRFSRFVLPLFQYLSYLIQCYHQFSLS